MYLANSVRHPHLQTPSEFVVDAPRLEALTARLRKGDKTVYREIIEHHVKLVRSVARRYSRMKPSVGSVFEAEAFFALTKTVSRIMIGTLVMKDNNITPYLISKIHSHLSDVSHSNVFGIPARTISWKKLKLKQIDCVNMLEQPNNEVPMEEIEELKKIARDEIDLQILLLKFENYTDLEIIESLGIHKATFYRRYKAIQGRYLAIHE